MNPLTNYWAISDPNCGDAFYYAIDDTGAGGLFCGASNPSNSAVRPSTRPVCIWNNSNHHPKKKVKKVKKNFGWNENLYKYEDVLVRLYLLDIILYGGRGMVVGIEKMQSEGFF